MISTVAVVQGVYFVLTGIWPLVSIGTFQKVTGPKTDLWLVKTLGLVIGVIGASLILAGSRQEITPAVAMLGMGSALVLAGVDLFYVARGVISRVYLLDAVGEIAILAAWMMLFR